MLQKECEKIQVVKASTSKLENKSLPEADAKKLLYVQLELYSLVSTTELAVLAACVAAVCCS